jgi:large subunit ribosomal protein L29
MKVSDVRNLPDDEVVDTVEKTRSKIFRMRFKAKGSGVENPALYKQTKRDLARLLTVLRERELRKKART